MNEFLETTSFRSKMTVNITNDRINRPLYAIN